MGSFAWHGGTVTAVASPDAGEVVYSRMKWNTPLSEDHAAILLDRLGVTGGDEVLDLGCGWGELLLRAVANSPAARGTGVDSDPWAIQRGRDAAAKRGLSRLVTSPGNSRSVNVSGLCRSKAFAGGAFEPIGGVVGRSCG
jgi:precorrin-6B methylase 2